MRGVWDLTEPRDLLRKLEGDLARMQAAPRDARPAFDFFVTAYHLADWLEHDRSRRNAVIAGSPLLQIAGVIANGSKHFTTDDPRVGSQTGMRGPHGVGPGGILVPLSVNIDDDMARRVPCSTNIDAIALAKLLLEWWKAKLFPP